MRPIVLALCLVPFSTVSGAESGDVFVAPAGSDAAAGTADRPLASITKARDVVRGRVAAGLTKDLRVVIRGGVYELAEPLRFGPEDSGSDAHSITYAAQPGEKVVISGGRRVTDWRRGPGDVWTAELPEVEAGGWFFRQLFVAGRRATRARQPNAGTWLTVKTVTPDFKTLSFDRPLPAGNLGGKDAEILMLHNWSVSRALIAASDGERVTSATPIGWIGHGALTCASPHKPTALENARVFLDEPGEWCLERSTGTLSYLARAGEDPATMTIVAPRLERLLVLEGTGEKPVRGLRFVGLTFEHAEFPLPAFGYSEIQAGHYGPGIKQPTHVQPVAIECVRAVDCRWEGCRIAHTGTAGIGLGAGCRRNAIVGCELTDIGGNGVMVGWRGKGELGCGSADTLAADWADAADVPVANEVAHNWIHDCATVSHGGVGVWVGFSADTRIAHNEIHDLPYTGVSVGFRWNPSPTSQCRCIVERNHIHDVMRMLADGGGVYTLGYQPGTVVRFNHVHDVRRSRVAHGGAPNNGFFLDEGSKGFLFERNVVHGTSGEPVRFNNCQRAWHEWKDNVFGPRSATKGRVGAALACDGAGTHVESSHAAALEPERLTVEAWLMMQEHPSGEDKRRWIVCKNGNEWSQGHYALCVDDDKVGGLMNIGGGRENAFAAWSDAGLVELGRWHHAAITFDGAALQVFLDGRRVATTPVGRPRTPGEAPLAIACRQDRFGFFKGVIDEVRVYGRALSEAELAGHARGPERAANGKEEGVVGHWSFDDGTDADALAAEVEAKAGPDARYERAWQAGQ